MTRETDAQQAYMAASGVEAVCTDVNTVGVHTAWNPPHSFGSHYEPATQSHSGRIGCATDWAHAHGDGASLTPELLAIWQAWAPEGKAGRLQELFYAGADYCVYGGKWMPWSKVPKGARDVIKAGHRNHVHVSVKPKTLVAWSGPPVNRPDPALDPQPKAEDEDMSGRFKVDCPTGGYWLIQRKDGGVNCYKGAPFHGSASGLPLAAPVIDFEPYVVDGEVRGYWLLGKDGGVFSYDAPYCGSYAAHPEWHNGSRTFVGIQQSGNGYVLYSTVDGTEPPVTNAYDFTTPIPDPGK